MDSPGMTHLHDPPASPLEVGMVDVVDLEVTHLLPAPNLHPAAPNRSEDSSASHRTTERENR